MNILNHLQYSELNNENRNSSSHYAAVAICVLPIGELIYIKRQYTMPTHKGQIAFPGGKAQLGDLDIIDTAIRETEEELLISRNIIEPLGILKGFDTKEFEFPVFPVVCRLDAIDLLNFDNREVKKVYSVEVSYLKEQKNWEFRGWYDSDWIIRIEDDILWGATANMTLDLLQLKFD